MIKNLKKERSVVLVLTDGRSDITRDDVPLDVLCKEGIRVGGLGIKDYSGRFPNEEQLGDIVCKSNPKPGFLFLLDNFAELLEESFLQNLTASICQDKKCPNYKCPISFSTDTDITIMMDSSASVGSKNFEATRTFVKRLAESFLRAEQVGPVEVRVAVGQYSKEANMEADFTDDYHAVAKQIDGIVFQNSVTDVTGALSFVIEKFKSSGNKKKKLLLFSDARSQGVTENDIQTRVREVQAAGIELYVLAVGSQVNESNLRYLVSQGRTYDVTYAQRHLFRAVDYPSLLRGVFHQTVARKVSLA
ncbi:hypothetical protein COCON_G00048510 [Conger conger]|uniref:VWFA domain-containing protein n=2 Tax=Conger conger TaxID=82655 RepID=A0A9Q1DV17_CONCO|nr:hypothetical protein COCON_G00048510 [Conger conger]